MGSVNLRDGLVGEWLMKGNLDDTSGTSDGSNNGATLTTDKDGRLNSAYDFESSSSQYVDVDGLDSFNEADFSYSFWMYLESKSANMAPITIGPSSWIQVITTTGFHCYTVDNRNGTGGTQRFYENSATSLNTGQWYHIVAVASGTNLEVYKDGEVWSLTEATQSIGGTYNKGTIGGRGVSSGVDLFWDGKLGNIQLWDRTLSAEEVKQLYSEIKPHYQPIFEDCVMALDFDGDVKDLINNTTITSTGPTLTTDRLGTTDHAYNFNGTSDKMSYPTSGVISLSKGSIVIGFIPDTIDTSGQDSGEAYIHSRFSSRLYIRQANATIKTSVGSTHYNDGGGTLVVGQFHVVALTWDGTNMKTYLDGVELDSRAYTGFTTNSSPAYLGQYGFIDKDRFDGKFQFANFYSSAISAARMKEIYQITKTKNITPFSQGGKD